MESQPQNPEFRINPENFHPCMNSCMSFYQKGGWHIVFGVDPIGVGMPLLVCKISHELDGRLKLNLHGYNIGV